MPAAINVYPICEMAHIKASFECSVLFAQLDVLFCSTLKNGWICTNYLFPLREKKIFPLRQIDKFTRRHVDT